MSTQPPADLVPAVQQGPVPFLKGRFALYETPDHGLVLSYRPEGAEADKQLVVPAFILQMAAQTAGGSAEDLFAKIKEVAL